MRCPHCGQEHPDDFLLCPYTGKSLITQTKVCGNPDCQYPNVPMDAKFFPKCGWAFSQDNYGLTDYNIILGKTTIEDLEEKFDITLEEGYCYGDINEYELENGIFLMARNKKSSVMCLGSYDVSNNIFQKLLKSIFHIENFKSESNLKSKLKNICNQNSWQIKYEDGECSDIVYFIT